MKDWRPVSLETELETTVAKAIEQSLIKLQAAPLSVLCDRQRCALVRYRSFVIEHEHALASAFA